MEGASRPLERPGFVSEAARRAGWIIGRLDRLVARLPTPKPWMVLGLFVVGSWAVMLGVALAAQHNGWLYYESGDGVWYYTTAWALGHGHIPVSAIGYGYPLLIAPFARLGGSNLVGGMPYIVVFNAVVLTPIALCCVYGIARMIAGQVYAYAVALFWVVVPVLAVPDFYERYRQTYVTMSLPAVLGLTPLGDYPSMVALLVAAYFAFRTLETGDRSDALLAGLAIGFAIGIKPANTVFLAAPILAFLAARRTVGLAFLGLGLIPSLIALALWKERGLGHLPLLALGGETTSALGKTMAPLGFVSVHHYFSFDWHRFTRNLDGFREYTWSRRLLEWGVVAGLIGIARRSIPVAILIGGWFAAYMFTKGASIADVYAGSFFRYMAPSFPAVFLLICALPLLLPLRGPKLALRGRASIRPSSSAWKRRFVWIAVALSALPILLFAVLPVSRSEAEVKFSNIDLYVPGNQFALTAAVDGRTVSLRWPSQSHGSNVAYAIFRSTTDPVSCQPTDGASECAIVTNPSSESRAAFRTARVPPGRWVYRVAVLISPFGTPLTGDELLLSKPLTVNVK